MNQSFQDLSSLGLSLLAFAGAEVVEGNGFIAVFFAGLVLGNTARSVCACLFEFAEAEGQLLALLVFMIFGAVMAPDALEYFHWTQLIYAVFSLTLVKMLPVAISLIGTRLKWVTVIFLGWFGPRGIASILYALLLLEGVAIPGMNVVLSVVMTTVLPSVFVHGVTAYPASIWYLQFTGRAEKELAEHKQVEEMPIRIPVISHRSRRTTLHPNGP